MWLDFFGAITSLIATLLFVYANRYAWLMTCLAAGVNGVLYFQQGIYADTLLELAYFVMSAYGWIAWKNPSDKPALPVQNLSLQQVLQSIGISTALFILLYFLLTQYTPSKVPGLDAITVALSLTAQGLMCRKYIEAWFFWWITDLLYTGLYSIKHLPFHVALMLIYTSLAVQGYLRWKQLQPKPLLIDEIYHEQIE